MISIFTTASGFLPAFKIKLVNLPPISQFKTTSNRWCRYHCSDPFSTPCPSAYTVKNFLPLGSSDIIFPYCYISSGSPQKDPCLPLENIFSISVSKIYQLPGRIFLYSLNLVVRINNVILSLAWRGHIFSFPSTILLLFAVELCIQ